MLIGACHPMLCPIHGFRLLAYIMPKGFQLVIDDANWVVDPTSETSSISIPDAELRAMLWV